MADTGLTIKKGIANGVGGYREPSKRNIGVLGAFNRGKYLVPVKVNSLEEFYKYFGGQSNEYFGSRVVKSIFDEAGEADVTLYVARANSGTVADATIPVGGGSIYVKAVTKGVEDAGSWGNKISVDIYKFDTIVRDQYAVKVKYDGDVVETFYASDLVELQDSINKVSNYVFVNFESVVLTKSALAGTTVNLASNITAGVTNKFTPSVDFTAYIGKTLYSISTGKDFGVIKSVDATSHEVTLQGVATSSVSSGTDIAIKDTTPLSATLFGGASEDLAVTDITSNWNCFDGYDIQVLCNTEFHTLEVARSLKEYCVSANRPLGVFNFPMNSGEEIAELWANELQGSGEIPLAGYLGWGTFSDENGNPILLPIIGAVLGAGFLRTPYVQGDYIHIPPAGMDSLFRTVQSMTPARLSQTSINRIVQEFTCNIIQYAEGQGYYVGTSRTYSTSSLFQSIHIILQTSYYVRKLREMMRFMEQKPNTPELRNKALIELRSFFQTEYNNGALERSVDFEEAYQGVCDESNNDFGRNRKEINIDCYWIPTECTESIKISLLRNDGILITKIS